MWSTAFRAADLADAATAEENTYGEEVTTDDEACGGREPHQEDQAAADRQLPLSSHNAGQGVHNLSVDQGIAALLGAAVGVLGTVSASAMSGWSSRQQIRAQATVAQTGPARCLQRLSRARPRDT